MFDEYFLYPLWLWLIPLALLILYSIYQYQQLNKKTDVFLDSLVDKKLQPFVISTPDQVNKRGSIIMYAISGILAILALAGPSLYKEKVPLYEANQGLVIALDLSTSMLAEDIKPSRIKRAKLAMIALLNPHETNDTDQIKYEGYVGLVVFAAEAFTLSPLTNDVATIISQITYMSPKIMPSQGSRLDKAIDQASNLLSNSGYTQGQILLITDGLSDEVKTKKSTQSALNKGFKVSILAVGSPQGGIIPYRNQRDLNTPFLLDLQRKEVIAKLDIPVLKSIADAGKGKFLNLSDNPNAIATILKTYQSETTFKTDKTHQENILEYKINTGIWLLFPLLVLILFSWHRGLIWVLCFIVLIPTEPVYAADEAFNWDNLWLNQQLQAKEMLLNGNANDAQPLFTESQWKASAAYKAEDYELAVQLFSQDDSAKSWYNKGNALLNLQQVEQAIEAYNVVLKKQPTHKDARYNLQLAKKAQEELSNAKPNEKPLLQIKESTDTSDTENRNQVEQKRTKDKQQSEQEKEQHAYEKQWLKSIPDDPSGLWRRKFKHQYQKRSQQPESQPW